MSLVVRPMVAAGFFFVTSLNVDRTGGSLGLYFERYMGSLGAGGSSRLIQL